MQLYGKGISTLNYLTSKAFHYENGFYLTSDPIRIGKLIAHYEIYKLISGVSGDIVECGVFKGASLIRFATFRDMLESSYSRKVIGFDAFGKFPETDDKQDSAFIKVFEQEAGNGISVNDLDAYLTKKPLMNYQLIEGDILQEIPKYTSENPQLKIALLHIDVDVYDATLTALNYLYDRVVTNGVIVFDDFGKPAGIGETRAIDEFFQGRRIEYKKIPFSHTPTYILK